MKIDLGSERPHAEGICRVPGGRGGYARRTLRAIQGEGLFPLRVADYVSNKVRFP
jgi:hypothetical protein